MGNKETYVYDLLHTAHKENVLDVIKEEIEI